MLKHGKPSTSGQSPASDDDHYLKQELYREVRENPEIFEFLQHGSLDGIWYWDLKHPEREWLSPEFWRLLGYQPETKQHLAAEWQSIINQDDLSVAIDNFQKHCENPNHPYDQEVRYQHRDSTTVWVRCRGIVIRDDEGKPHRMLGAHSDITRLKESEASFRRFERMFNATQDLVAFVDRDYIYRAVNLSYQRAWKMPRTAFEGRSVPQVMGEDVFNKAVKKHLDRCFKGHPVHYQQWFEFPGLGKRLMEVTYNPSQIENGHIEGCVVNARDITQHHVDKAQIIKQSESLQKSNKELASFAYVASHDLKSPLRAIKQLAQWIKEDLDEVPKEVEQHISTMEGRITRMENLLIDLLNYSRIGKTDTKIQAFDTKVLIDNMLDLSAATQAFALKLHGDFPVLNSLKVPFEQVVRNIVSNSVKHHDLDHGKIDVYTDEDEAFNIFYFCDDGPGVAIEFHEKIFEMFQTLRPRDEIEGSGMGLASVRKICESLGGRVQVSAPPEVHADANTNATRGLCIKLMWPKRFQD